MQHLDAIMCSWRMCCSLSFVCYTLFRNYDISSVLLSCGISGLCETYFELYYSKRYSSDLIVIVNTQLKRRTIWGLICVEYQFCRQVLETIKYKISLFINLLYSSNYGAWVTDLLHMNKNTCSAVATLCVVTKKTVASWFFIWGCNWMMQLPF